MNNISQLKYAIEVEKTGSISKAAENLFMAQPHLSKAIKELEDDIGITIFNRNSKGARPTAKGLEFLAGAKAIVAEVELLERRFKEADGGGDLRVVVPRSGLAAKAFVSYAAENADGANISYLEADAETAVASVADGEYGLAIVRYNKLFESDFKKFAADNQFEFDQLTELNYVFVASKTHPLAKLDAVCETDLAGFLQLKLGDEFAPHQEQEKNAQKMICDKTCLKMLLAAGSNFYALTPPLTEGELKERGLTQKTYVGQKNSYKEVLLFKKGYKQNELEAAYVKTLKNLYK